MTAEHSLLEGAGYVHFRPNACNYSGRHGHRRKPRLAELIGVSARVYNRWEKGGNVPHFDTVVRIADILQVSLDDLAGRKEPSPELKLRNYELRQLCQQCDDLPDEDQQALIVMMDSLVKKANLTKVMGKAASR